jgi:hypothetical protein
MNLNYTGFYLTHIADDYAKNSFKKWKEYEKRIGYS